MIKHPQGLSFLATVRCTPTPVFLAHAGAELDTVQSQWRAQLEQLAYRLLNAPPAQGARRPQVRRHARPWF